MVLVSPLRRGRVLDFLSCRSELVSPLLFAGARGFGHVASAFRFL